MIAQKKKNVKKWLKRRHEIVVPFLRECFRPIALWMYHIKIERFKQENGRQYLVLANHQTGFDQFFPSFAFKQHLYYVASEDIFSMGWLSDAIRWIANPIPIKKQVTDIKAVMNCMRVAKEGGSIAIFPEGNRTFSGKTGYMNPAIGGLAKKLGLPIAIFKIEGGYGVQPRWSDVRRKGKMRAYVSSVLEPEEYKSWSNEQMYQVSGIRREKPLQVLPIEEMVALMRFMVEHNDAHAQELADLAQKLKDSGKEYIGAKLMDAVADFDMANAKLSAVFKELSQE